MNRNEKRPNREQLLDAAFRTAIQDINVGAPDVTAGLRGLPPFVYRDRLVWAYQREQDPERRRRLARASAELCGEEIESRLLRLAV